MPPAPRTDSRQQPELATWAGATETQALSSSAAARRLSLSGLAGGSGTLLAGPALVRDPEPRLGWQAPTCFLAQSSPALSSRLARAFGAPYPSLVVATLPNCADVPAALREPRGSLPSDQWRVPGTGPALRAPALAPDRAARGPAPGAVRCRGQSAPPPPPPQWVAPVPSPGVRDQAAAAGERAPVPIVVYDDGPGAGFRC